MRGQRGVAAAVHEPQRVVVGDFLREPDAARAEDATLVVQHDARPEVDVLGLVDLLLQEARTVVAVLDAELL